MTTRTCRKCSEPKPPEDFYKSNRSQCKKCLLDQQREYRSRVDREKKRVVEQAWRDKNVGRLRKKYRRFREKHPDDYRSRIDAWFAADPRRRAAHLAVRRAIKSGKLARPNRCGRCKKACRPEAHHHDYAKPLEVEWVCKSCHVRADREKHTEAA